MNRDDAKRIVSTMDTLYLLGIDNFYKEWVINTEAHPLKIIRKR